LLLLAQNKISPRRASVLAYITNQLLRTVVVINHKVSREPEQIIVDVARPCYTPEQLAEEERERSTYEYRAP